MYIEARVVSFEVELFSAKYLGLDHMIHIISSKKLKARQNSVFCT